MKRHEIVLFILLSFALVAAFAMEPASILLDDSRAVLASCQEALTARYPKDEAATVRYMQQSKSCIKRAFGVLEQHDGRLMQIRSIAVGK